MKTESIELYVRAFIEAVGRPVVEKLESETGQPIAATVAVIESGRIVVTSSVPEGRMEGDRAVGELRLTFRERFTSVSFEAQAILRGLAPDTGYSGFLLQGKIVGSGESFQIKLTGRTNLYNDWEWRPTFRCTTDEVSK